MSIQIGVIAEDVSDVSVAKKLLQKRATKSFQVKHHIGHGCGTIVAKCGNWAKNLSDRGCSLLILLHDLDEKNLATLRANLHAALTVSPIKKIAVVIPVREMEAWLLSDGAAIAKALNISKEIPPVGEPERQPDAKKKLGELIYKTSEKKVTYVNTIHNEKIANEIALEAIRAKCPSFAAFDDFAKEHLVKSKKAKLPISRKRR